MNDLISLSLQAAGMVLAADFAAGLVHWIEDAYIREDTPVLGAWIGRPNIVHHHLPRRMTRNTWWESNQELLVAMGVLIIAAALIAAGGLAIVRTMWGMRAPLRPGASEGTETLWLVLPLALGIALVVWVAMGIS